MDLGPLQGTINNLILIAQIVGGLVFILMLSIAGIYFMTSGGNPAGIERSKTAAMNACIGLALIFSATAIKGLLERAIMR